MALHNLITVGSPLFVPAIQSSQKFCNTGNQHYPKVVRHARRQMLGLALIGEQDRCGICWEKDDAVCGLKSYAEMNDAAVDVCRIDPWGGPILYSPKPDGTVLLSSKGKDGKQVYSLEFVVPVAKPETKAATTRVSP